MRSVELMVINREPLVIKRELMGRWSSKGS